MKKNQIIFVHVFYWQLLLIKYALTYFNNEDFRISLINVTLFTANFLSFYINYFFIAPKFFNPKRLYLSIFGYFLGVVVFVFFRYSFEEVLLPIFAGFRNYAEGTSFVYYFYDNIYYSALSIFVSTSLWLFTYYSKLEKERVQLIEEKKNAELQALKTQINPHFIFNSLNNIYSLVYQNSDKALPALEELSQLLRYSTKDLEKDFILLDKEVGYMESLIALEKLRIKNPELILFNKDLKNPKLSISPMLLVPFVENAFKHGDINGKGMELKVSDDNGRLHFYLRNFKKQRMKDFSSGIGIGNVRKRLQLIYPDKHWLEITETEDTFIVDLKIDLNTNKLTAY
ncbi:histidine kinase [Elizabethkingia miricola]|uniref:sensor histidine kinase n=1 Tax=Elizabethkingia miricola TaxID=172045 RepID=UPI000B35B91D|nr:histidine kinase [Elizabethkingia miricola]NHQ65519.1 histidine kinase [Elizabethkingia miricola]NHQ69148.1 histidine kinase [Elizabethkingia miricola]NHQ76286.1 histidine kinase [Elizabethkingia miricola]PSL90362.1 histidine kinase [Elizabethkingia miricola]QHQ86844.1 histidine kinase [Elizabethkingia miricola]